jgi:hypothetical protein
MPLSGRASELVAVQLGSILGTFALEEEVADRSVLVSREPFSITRSPGPLRHQQCLYHDFGGAADRGKATGDEGIDRTSPSRPAPCDPTISRAPRA